MATRSHLQAKKRAQEGSGLDFQRIELATKLSTHRKILRGYILKFSGGSPSSSDGVLPQALRGDTEKP